MNGNTVSKTGEIAPVAPLLAMTVLCSHLRRGDAEGVISPVYQVQIISQTRIVIL